MPEKIGETKIVYALICYDAAHSGVYKKILDQIAFWKLSGYATQLFVITDLESQEYWQKIDDSAVILFDTSFLSKLLNRFKLIRMAIKTNPSLIYLRDSFPIYIPRCTTPIILEVQSLVGWELKLRSYAKYVFFSLFKKNLYSRVDAAVYVTNELLALNEFRINSYVPKIAIGNGIDLNRIDILPQNKSERPALFFVGSPNQLWHGVSELLDFALFNSGIDVHIVGDAWDKAPPNVFFYGKLNPTEYRLIASKCNAGVGTLNLHAKQMREASPLKVREYLALGLPVILKYQDTDLNSSEPFILQLPSDGRLLMEFSTEIQAFLKEWAIKRVARDKIINIDVVKKEEIRLEFFGEVVAKFVDRKLPRG
jgi:glycosyltransferase involved in cell wall biosynthesis